jgi:uncharacterized protein (TIGR02118 family)
MRNCTKKRENLQPPSLLFHDRLGIFTILIVAIGPVASMVKLVALYQTPSDQPAFEQHFTAVHLPLLQKYPGLKDMEITRITGAPPGDVRFSWMVELYFDDRDSMDRALASSDGKAVARDLMAFSAHHVTVFHGEVTS